MVLTVEARAAALGGVAVRVEVLANVPMPSPHVEHHRGQLLAERLPRLAYDGHVVVLLHAPVR